jgi:site-specific DNA-methyltransferase (adenine-specific)
MHDIRVGDSRQIIQEVHKTDLTFLDPPFNQGKEYEYHDDNLAEQDYWKMMYEVCKDLFAVTNDGGALYFMQREKKCEDVLRVMREAGWAFQNLIIWKKFTSAAAPSNIRHAKHYQIIAYGTKGVKPKTFNKLRIDPPRLAHHKYDRDNGMFVTDLWDDIKELTAGYFSGDEALRKSPEYQLIRADYGGYIVKTVEPRFHKQQSPLALLTRIILTSSNPGDWVFDPFAGTGTTGVAAHQLGRHFTCIDIDPKNVECIKGRIANARKPDDVSRYKADYKCTADLDKIWGKPMTENDVLPNQEIIPAEAQGSSQSPELVTSA